MLPVGESYEYAMMADVQGDMSDNDFVVSEGKENILGWKTWMLDNCTKLEIFEDFQRKEWKIMKT